ncbi:hypothetical protein NZK35_18210 [Stieleria sp. ICT_E10.1]|uniref:hypothetical protein n=1 Tax=Stieleria sedimenti TaxID=2976331 RepID=UPI0021800223|nr:hypothetical protein [Stieleria sedimenti]MCS7468591.1 hypothetical protein [Stieleria sedimenti]
MYERRKEALGESDQTKAITRQIKDVFRCIDFLVASESYGDATIGYMGSSYGARVGPIAAALDPRIEVAIYLNGGAPRSGTEEVIDTVHFAPRATQPALMLNGIDDFIFPSESSQKPLFRLLGANPEQKEHLLVGIGHSVDNEQMADEVDRFLSKHVGKTGYQPKSWRDKVDYIWTKTKALVGSKAGRAKAKELLPDMIATLKTHGSTADDARLLADAQYYQAVLSPDLDGEIALLREAVADAERALGNTDAATQRLRQYLASALTRHSLKALLAAESADSSEFQQSKQTLSEISELIPQFAWPELGKALAAFRERDRENATEHLKACESLPFTWGLEFVLRAHLAADQGRGQEAQDWLSVLGLERAKNYVEGGLPTPPDLVAQARDKVKNLETEQTVSKNEDEALRRLVEEYPSHYYLHWLSGLQAVRSEQMEAAHEAFAVAFEMCPGFRTTDWYAITSQWLGDQASLECCQNRLIELAKLKDGCWVWDGIHIARAYCRIEDSRSYPAEDAAVLQEYARLVAPWFTYGAPRMLGPWLEYRLGKKVKIKSYNNNGHPEQQAESMILDAITEYRFGDRSAAFSKLDNARRFIEDRIPSPDGEAFKYIGADHAWAVSRLFLREASALIELDSETFDARVTAAVGRLRSDLNGELGEENTRRILLQVGEALVKKYSSDEPSNQQ